MFGLSDVCPSVHLQTSDGPLNSKEDLQRQEDEKVCSCEKKHLEEMIATNKQLLQASNEEMRQAKRLQVSLRGGHVTSWLDINT